MSSAEVSRTEALEAFGRRLRQEREARGLSQEELAHRAGISRVHVQHLESGWSDRSTQRPANPKLETLIALADQLAIRIVIDVAHPSGLVIWVDHLP